MYQLPFRFLPNAYSQKKLIKPRPWNPVFLPFYHFICSLGDGMVYPVHASHLTAPVAAASPGGLTPAVSSEFSANTRITMLTNKDDDILMGGDEVGSEADQHQYKPNGNHLLYQQQNGVSTTMTTTPYRTRPEDIVWTSASVFGLPSRVTRVNVEAVKADDRWLCQKAL